MTGCVPAGASACASHAGGAEGSWQLLLRSRYLAALCSSGSASLAEGLAAAAGTDDGMRLQLRLGRGAPHCFRPPTRDPESEGKTLHTSVCTGSGMCSGAPVGEGWWRCAGPCILTGGWFLHRRRLAPPAVCRQLCAALLVL